MYSALPSCEFEASLYMPTRTDGIDVDIVTPDIGGECAGESDNAHL